MGIFRAIPDAARLSERSALSLALRHARAARRRGPGDTVCIPPATPHRVANTGAEPLRILCGSSLAYAHDDTDLLEP